MKPLTRIENFLAKIAGNPAANAEMKPRTRKEYFLNEIAAGSGYDLVLIGNDGTVYPDGDVLSAITIAKGSIEAAEAKAKAGEVVRGVMYWVFNNSYYSGTFTMNDFYFNDSYKAMRFGGMIVLEGTLTRCQVNCVYNDSHELVSAAGSSQTVSTT